MLTLKSYAYIVQKVQTCTWIVNVSQLTFQYLVANVAVDAAFLCVPVSTVPIPGQILLMLTTRSGFLPAEEAKPNFATSHCIY